MIDIQDFSILAPVPLEHLQSGAEISGNTGFVAFGSRKWELFRKVDELRADQRVPVLIYPSHEDVPAKDSFIVSWVGWYVGCEESGNGKHSNGMLHRPRLRGNIRRIIKGTGRYFGTCPNCASWLPRNAWRFPRSKRSRVAGAKAPHRADQNW